jgi:hypothetical protein
VRLVPHLYLPSKWHLSLDVGLVTEFSFQKKEWDRNSPGITILPVLEKRSGRTQIDLNPTFTHSLHGPASARGWGFGLAGRVGFAVTGWFTPSLEYYTDWGRLPGLAPIPEQVHQYFPAAISGWQRI